jgi:hypothetical protein
VFPCQNASRRTRLGSGVSSREVVQSTVSTNLAESRYSADGCGTWRVSRSGKHVALPSNVAHKNVGWSVATHGFARVRRVNKVLTGL